MRKLRISVYFGKRYFHVAQGAWCVMTRNVGNRWVFPLPPTARGYTKLGEYSSEMGNCDLEVLATHADVGGISEVRKASAAKKEGWEHRMRIIESDFANIIDIFARY